MGTKKALPKHNNGTFYCGSCGSVIYPCEKYCDECYLELDWTNYNEELLPLPEMRQPDETIHSDK